MSRITLSGNASGTGNFTLASPNSNTDRTLTLPDATGTVLTTATPGIPINGPAFAAYEGTAQALTANVATKLVFGTELFDTNNNFASSTFTPTVAGYYQLSAGSYISAAGTKLLNLYKNGVLFLEFGRNASNTDTTLSGSALVYANGSTDYFDFYGLSTVSANAGVAANPQVKWFTGALVRAV